ncbi:MAG: hypothetical protein M1816_003359 [Peltula sp. TS41687]|nr:MAG: hypothetical protein M1816_003359 [Peltula sp. TS41687]
MSTRYDYTPLETLLLTQSLATYGTDSSSFNRISHSLQENVLLRQQQTFNPERLHPDALRNLSTALLEEGRKLNGYPGQSKETNEVNGTDAVSEGGSRKRKLSSPSGYSNTSPRQNSSAVAQVIDGLYLRYKDHLINYIRDDEQEFRTVQQDIKDIEHGEWDQRLLSQVTVVEARDEPIPVPEGQLGTSALRSVQTAREKDSVPAQKDQSPGVPSATVPNREDRIEMRDGSLEHDRTVTSGPQYSKPISAQDQVRNPSRDAGASIAQEVKPKDTARLPLPVDVSTHRNSEATNLDRQESIQAQQPDAAVQLVSTPAARLILPPVGGGPSSQGNLPVHTTLSETRVPQQLASSIGNMFLPVKDNIIATGSPNRQLLDTPSTAYPAPPFDIPPQTTPVTSMIPTPLGGSTTNHNERPVLPPLVSHPPLAQSTVHTAPRQFLSLYHIPIAPSTTTTDTATSLPPATTVATSHPHEPSTSTVHDYSAIPPLKHNLQSSSRPLTVSSTFPQPPPSEPLPPLVAGIAQSPPAQAPYQEPPSYPSLPPGPTSTKQEIPSTSELTPAPLRNVIDEPPKSQQILTTPITSTSLCRGHGHLSLDTSVSSTRWKPLREGEVYKSPQTPEAPPYSPLSEVEVPPSTHPDVRRTTTTSPTPQSEIVPTRRNSRLSSTSNQTQHEQRRPSVKARQSEERTPASRDHVGVRTRSQSILSQQAGSPWPIIKKEPSTSVAYSGDEETDGVEPTVSKTRSRSNTKLRTEPANDGRTKRGMGTLGKRKRGSPEVMETPSPGGMGKESDSIPVGHSYTLATRNFPRTTAPLLNDISAHRFVSIFAAPVKEKDAPGYKNIIYQPQDLKSIKAAIAHGSKAVAAHNASDITAGSPAQAGSTTPSSARNTTLWIPRNPDVVPPRGIVNSAQLEKELMRMFANAVMFNPDPDRGFAKSLRYTEVDADKADHDEDDEKGGVVKDTREMFEHVEKIVTDWRAAERTAEVAADRAGKPKATSGASIGLEDDEMRSTTNGDAGEDGLDLDEGSVGTVKRRRRN